MKFRYTVIIPHRDSFKLLQIAIASIPDREDIQVIVVDNSINDFDFKKLEVRQKSTIKIIYSDNTKGAGHARNQGLKIVKGSWVLFLDADDFFNENAFKVFDTYINSDYDIVYFGSNSIYLNTDKSADRHIGYSSLVADFVGGVKNAEDNLRYKFVTPWAKLIRSKLIYENNVWFDEVPASNDLMFSIKIGHYAQSIFADVAPVYCITASNNSLTRTKTSINSRSRFMASIRQYHFVNSIGRPDLRFMLMSQILSSINFGLNEFLWYLKISYKERVNIFLGIERWPILILNKVTKLRNALLSSNRH